MINKANHRNGITLPNGEHYEARVGSTRWFNAERAERALSEVRPEVDRAIELVNRAFFNEDAVQAVKTVAVLKNRFPYIFDCVVSTSAVPCVKVISIMTGNVSEEELNEMAAKWQATLEKNASKLFEMGVRVAMRYVKEGHWQFWSKNGWFQQVEVDVEEVAEVENVEVAEAEQVEVESSEAEEVKAEVAEPEVEEEVSTGRLIARMFDASKPERAFSAMVKIVGGGLNMKKVGGLGLAKLNVAGKVISIDQIAYEAKNGSKRFTSEFRQAAVEAWSDKLANQADRIAEYVKNVAELLGVEVEADEAKVEADEAKVEAEVEKGEKNEDEMTAVEVAEAILDEANPERGLRLAFKKGILPKWFQFTRDDYKALDPTDLWITSWNDAAAQLFRNLAGEKEKKIIVETWREHLKSVKPAIKRHSFLTFIEEAAKEKARARKARK